MTESSESRRALHPLVARLLQEYSCPSPGRVPRDPEQPRQGCFKELKRTRDRSARSRSAHEAKEVLLQQLQLDNKALNPVSGVKLRLEGPLQSSILQRRALCRPFKDHKSA